MNRLLRRFLNKKPFNRVWHFRLIRIETMGKIKFGILWPTKTLILKQIMFQNVYYVVFISN